MYLGKTYFSFKYGMMSPEQLLQEAQQKGISHLTLTDINNTSGVLQPAPKSVAQNDAADAGGYQTATIVER